MRILDSVKFRAVGLACAALLLPITPAAAAWADDTTAPVDQSAAPIDPPPPADPKPAPVGKPVPVANAAPVPHLSSPENLPPYTTTTAEGSQDTDQLSYLRDVWHAVQEREISPKQALVLLAQRPMDADAAPPAGMPAGPQAPVAAPAPAPEDPVG
ncbi:MULTISPECIES: hypothetical protein [Mycolicibacterium]|jgi:hypothetical protein|uniref:Dopamine receptor D4 n=2 Tax=Mycolicibacterium TaxID=1866885 RepID=A0A1A0MMT0_MYCMU|nr:MULTISPECIES: hypothetical protein [Mycolicibacterium]OBA86381.1 hypothetical protein A5642_22735 [Mycolicibacterium mucogenicum]TDK87133.1 hypothetical protein EUA03_18150 [Mycolicibacterium mucogenicum]TLH67650.1 hypothetical protein C1S79_13940 [Mycolicibacterium phocaicum]BBZ53609.1 hypothetical protein MPHO_06010 [Mycolicibacterium phocaicum]